MPSARSLGTRTKKALSLVVLFLLVAAVAWVLVFRDQKSSSPSVGGRGPQIPRIWMTPADGEVVEDPGRALTLFFPQPVAEADFSFAIEPDPGGWRMTWGSDRTRVSLSHDRPFVASTTYRVRASVRGGPSLESRFTTPAADPTALLESDTARGAITIDQAATFRVLRLFRPRAVPEQYRYRRAPRSGTWDMLNVARQWDKLRPETIRELRPYFLRPDDRASAYYRRLFEPSQAGVWLGLPTVATVHAAEPYVKEVHHTATGYDVAIFGPSRHAALVRRARDLVAQYRMYEEYERLLHRKTFDYGDRTLYVFINPYLPDQEMEGATFEPAGLCWITDPGTTGVRRVPLISISARQVGEDPDLASVLAHEMFHAFQFAFSIAEENWLVEGTAVWAEDFIGHDWNSEQIYYSNVFNSEAGSHYRINERVLSERSYGMYLFFYYLTRVRSAGGEHTLRRIWEQCEGSPGNSLNSVKSAVGGNFNDVLKEYALFTLDKEQYEGRFPDAIGRYGGETPLLLADAHDFRRDWRISDDAATRTAVPVDPMAIKYLEVTNETEGLDAPTVRVVLEPFTESDSIAVQAVIKYRDGTAVMEDWTGRKERVFCLAMQRDNFSSIYVAVSSSADSGPTEAVLFDIVPADDVECIHGQMQITMSSDGQQQTRFSKRWGSDHRDEDVEVDWSHGVRFDLDLVPARPELAEEIVGALPEQLQKTARAEARRPERFYDENTGCTVHVFEVKDCRVGSFARSRRLSGREIQNDDFGVTLDTSRSDVESWSSDGISKRTREWLADSSLAVRVYTDQKSGRIKWVDLVGPVGVKAKGRAYHRIAGRRRVGAPPDTSYQEISRSHDRELNENMMAGSVSDRDRELPMHQDWRARQGGMRNASGRGERRRSLDRETTGDEAEKTIVTGQETKRVEWSISVEIRR